MVMALSPEVKKDLPVTEIPQDFSEVSPLVENKSTPGVTSTPTQFKAQVTDDNGKPIITTPQTQVITVQIPADPTVLAQVAKGSTDDSKTWWAAWFLRLIKRALHFGWKVATGGNNGTPAN